MASPKTRRVLAELRPRDENDVSKIFIFLSNFDLQNSDHKISRISFFFEYVKILSDQIILIFIISEMF